jgi:hypothetical protein
LNGAEQQADIGEIIRAYFANLERLIATFDFTRQGRHEALGKEAAYLVADEIQIRSSRDQRGPDGHFPPNGAAYTQRKRMRYGVELIGVRTGQMWSLPSLRGRIDIAPKLVIMTYGTGEYPPTDAIHPTYDEDTMHTDVSKAMFFTQRKGKFYALDNEIEDKLRAYFASEIDYFVRELNARP